MTRIKEDNEQTKQDKSKPNNNTKIICMLTTKLKRKETTLLHVQEKTLTEWQVQQQH